MNICKIRRLRTFLHCKCVLTMQQRPSKLSKDFMWICSHVALLHFVLVNSIFFLLPEIQVPGWARCWFQPLCPEEGMQLVVSSHGPHLVYPLPTPAAVLWPFTVTGAVEHLSQKSAHQCPKSEREAKSSVSCLLEKRWSCSLWISWLVGLVGVGAGYHTRHVLPVTDAEKAIGKAAKQQIQPFSSA